MSNRYNWLLYVTHDRKEDPRQGVAPLKGFGMAKIKRERFVCRFCGILGRQSVAVALWILFSLVLGLDL